MVFLWVLAAERYVPARRPRSHLPSPAPRAAGRGPSAGDGAKARARLAARPKRPAGEGLYPRSEDAGVWGSNPGSPPQNTGPQFLPGTGQKHPRGDEFHTPHPANGTVPTRRSASQLPKPVHRPPRPHVPCFSARLPHVAGRQPACSCLSPRRETGPKGLAAAETCPAGGTPGPAAASHPARSLQLARQSRPRARRGGGGYAGSPLVCPSPPATTGDPVTEDGAREAARNTHPAGT